MSTELTVVSHSPQSIWTNIETMLAGQLAQSSMAMYERDIRAYLAHATRTSKDPLDAQTFLHWRNYLSLETKMSPHTINRMLSAIKRVTKEAAVNKLISRDTALDFQDVSAVKVRTLKTRLKKNSRTRITPANMRKLCEAPDTSTLTGLRDHALLLTLASSGIRAAECGSLSQDQIKQVDGAYFVQISGKEDIEQRDAHLNTEACTAIEKWLEARQARFVGLETPYIFTSLEGMNYAQYHISETTVWKVVKRYAAVVGLANVKPHDFRRFVGTQIAKKDLRKAQLALGHKSIEVTAKHYVLDSLTGGETENLF